MPVASPTTGSGHAAPEQPEQPPQAGVGRREEPAQDDRRGGALGVARRFAGLPGLVDPADRARRRRGRRRTPREVVERRRPGRVLGERPDAGLLEAAQRLVERRAEGAVDGHHLAGRLHLAAERAVGGRELVEREARQLDDDVVERRLEGGDRRAGDDVGDLGQPPPDGDLGRDPRDRVAGRLAGERRRARHARVDLDHRVLGRVGRERELDVAAALDAERADDRERRAAQPLVDRVGQGLDRRDDDRVAGVDAERVDVLHRAHGDARVVGVAHDLVLDLLPADEALLDHDLVDRAGAQAGPDALAVGRLGLDDAAAGAAEREGRPDDRRQADLLERRAPSPSASSTIQLGAYGWPIRSSRSRNASRSSAIWIASSGVPSSLMSWRSKTPARARAVARLSAVWPPSPASRPSGRSLAMTASTASTVSGSR